MGKGGSGHIHLPVPANRMAPVVFVGPPMRPLRCRMGTPRRKGGGGHRLRVVPRWGRAGGLRHQGTPRGESQRKAPVPKPLKGSVVCAVLLRGPRAPRGQGSHPHWHPTAGGGHARALPPPPPLFGVCLVLPAQAPR